MRFDCFILNKREPYPFNLPRILTHHHFHKAYITNLKTSPKRVHLVLKNDTQNKEKTC